VRRGFLLTEGSLQVRTSGKPLRIETKFGQFVISEEASEARFAYAGGKIEAAIIRGSLTTEALDSANVVFKGAHRNRVDKNLSSWRTKSLPGAKNPPNPISLSFPGVTVPAPRAVTPVAVPEAPPN